ncbi:MAG TPA: hypothetical protein VI731_09035, partial [Bacteroidia bacterium]|nr:hypothetical protein [Bacteroidia bacterium]
MANRPGSVILRSFAIIILAVLPVITSFGQAPPPGAPADWHFVFAGKVTEFNEKKQKDLPLEGCTVALTKSGSPVETQVTDKSGKFKFALPPNGDYQISISKGDYINKRIAINTYNVPNERTHHPFTEFDVEIDLFKTFPGLDYGCLNKPIARIIYSPAPETDDFDYDKVYTAQIQACIENLKRLAADAKAKQKLYAAAVDEADRLFAANDFSNAKVKYNAALAILPNEQYPKDQIKKCDEKLGASAKLEADYKAAVDDGNAKFAAKDYAGAKARYQAASNLKPAEPYPKERMTACDAAIAGSAKEKQYTDALADADKKFTAKDFTGAKAGYQAASAMKPAEQYPKDRIKACDDGLAGAAKEKQYTDALADADKKFTAKDFTGAKAGYQAASSMKPAEQYPKDRIKTCDEEIAKLGKDKLYSDAIADADKKFDAKDFNGAKAKYQEATGIKPGEQYPRDRIRVCLDEIAKAGKEKTYNDVIAAADQKFTSRDFNGAKAKYQEAFGLKPGEQYPIDRIKACDDEIEKSEKDAEYTG